DESRHFDGFTNRLIDFLTNDHSSGSFRSSAGLAGLHKDEKLGNVGIVERGLEISRFFSLGSLHSYESASCIHHRTLTVALFMDLSRTYIEYYIFHVAARQGASRTLLEYFTYVYRVIMYDVSTQYFLPLCPPPPQPLSSANLPFTPSERYRPLTLFSPRHRATTTSVILSLPPAPPALYPSPPPTTPRSTVISRNVGYSGNLQTADHACSTASKEQTYAKSGNPIGSTDGSISAYRAR
ncbi:hypothetical protein ALC53_10406, partial [Atta colombica]